PPPLFPLSLHDALPISPVKLSRCVSTSGRKRPAVNQRVVTWCARIALASSSSESTPGRQTTSLPPWVSGPQSSNVEASNDSGARSEEHTSELHSLTNLV